MSSGEVDLMDEVDVGANAYDIQDVDIGDVVFRKRGATGSRKWANLIQRLKEIEYDRGVGITVPPGSSWEKLRNRVTQAVHNQVVNAMTPNEKANTRIRVRMNADLTQCIVSKHRRETKVVDVE